MNINQLLDAAARGDQLAIYLLKTRASAGDPQAENAVKYLSESTNAIAPNKSAEKTSSNFLQPPQNRPANPPNNDPGQWERLRDSGLLPEQNAALINNRVAQSTPSRSSQPATAPRTQTRPAVNMVSPQKAVRDAQKTVNINQSANQFIIGPKGSDARFTEMRTYGKPKEQQPQRQLTPQEQRERARQRQDHHARNQIKLANDALRADPNNQKTQADAQKQMSAAYQTLAQNHNARKAEGGGGGGGGGGRGGGGRGGGGGGGGGPKLTAKERNMAADAKAAKDAKRQDSRGKADSVYRNAEVDSKRWGENEAQRRERFEKSGLNPDYQGWRDNPDHAKAAKQAEAQGKHNKTGQWSDKPSGSGSSSGGGESGGKGTGWMGGHQTWSGYGDEWSAEAKRLRAKGDIAGAEKAEKAAQEFYDKDKGLKDKPKKLAESKPDPAATQSASGDSAAIPDIGMPGMPTIGPSASNSSGNASGALIGYLKKKKLGLV